MWNKCEKIVSSPKDKRGKNVAISKKTGKYLLKSIAGDLVGLGIIILELLLDY